MKSLSDIWRPESIPVVFSTSTRISVAKQAITQPTPQCQRQSISRRHSLQLPSPCSPTTQMSPLPPPSEAPKSSSASFIASQYLGEQFSNATVVSEKDLVPIRTFVQEVLRRSRTTCSVLQSALCYIEAIRNKVPELVEAERQGRGVKGEPELGERITKLEDELQDSLDFLTSSDTIINDGLQTECMPTSDNFDMNTVPTVLQTDATLVDVPQQMADGSVDPLKRRKTPAKPLPTLPALPSPLLCPRRAFLAALILASKFLQDRCYSNRAWAKLSGLPPREVGRCERALGDALEWRLWVGKGANNNSEESSRSVMRSKSESVIMLGGAVPSRSMSQLPSPPMADAGASPEFGRHLAVSCPMPIPAQKLQSLRRAATLPDDAAFRGVPPRYRAPGALPFAFNVGQTTTASSYMPSTSGEHGLPSFSALLSRVGSNSFFGTDEPTPRMFYSPENALDTPSTQTGSVWSPAPSSSSTDSSDSGSSAGSVATPPNNMLTPCITSRVGCGPPYVDISACDFSKNMYGGVANVSTTAAPIKSWYAQVLSAGFPGQEFGQLSMLDGSASEICAQV